MILELGDIPLLFIMAAIWSSRGGGLKLGVKFRQNTELQSVTGSGLRNPKGIEPLQLHGVRQEERPKGSRMRGNLQLADG